MLYQALFLTGLLALGFVYRQTLRDSTGTSNYAFTALYTCMVLYILLGFSPATNQYGVRLAHSGELLCFVMLFPLLFINIKHFTNLSLPQWRGLRAFSIGMALFVGIDAAVEVLDGREFGVGSFPTYLWVTYTYGLICVMVAAWRFSGTPRQRLPILVAMAVPVFIVGADISFRVYGSLMFNRSPALTVALISVCLFSFLVLRRQQFAIRPVPRSGLIDQVQDALVVVDANYRIVDCNQAASTWFSDPGQSIVGGHAAERLPKELSNLLAAGTAQAIDLEWTKNKVECWFEVHCSPLMIDGKSDGYLVTARDVTRRRQAENELRESRRMLELANSKLEVLANTDGLTGLYNRRCLMSRLASEIERHSRSGLTLGLLVIDLDYFKKVNDQFGHPAGDQVLQQVAQSMRETVRESDLVGRVGGEEFAVIVVDAKDEGPVMLAERLKKNIRDLTIVTDDSFRISVTASIGCVHFKGAVVDPATLMKLADQALYKSKRSGRDCVTSQEYLPLPTLLPNASVGT